MMRTILAALALLLTAGGAWAQSGQPNDCSGTVGTAAAAVLFPGSGKTGPTSAQRYITIANPHATNNLCVNATPGGTAVCAAAGTITIGPGGSASWWQPAYPPPAQLSIIASGVSTPYTCLYQ